MSTPRVPPVFVGGVAGLPDLFIALGRSRGIPRSEVSELVALLPDPIRTAPCFLDRLTGLWRYDFGGPFEGLPDGNVVLGTNMFHDVEKLYDVLACAKRRLPVAQLSSYVSRLGDAAKHDDTLVEFAPVLRLDATVKLTYEVEGQGEGNKTIDWMMRSGDQVLLLDVKNRTRDLLEAFARIQAGERDPDGSGPAPLHDPALLFRSVEAKFKPCAPGPVVQGAWVHTPLKQEETELLSAFGSLDPTRVHVVLLGGWEDDVYVLAGDNTVKEDALRLLRVRESRRFVFQRRTGCVDR